MFILAAALRVWAEWIIKKALWFIMKPSEWRAFLLTVDG